MRAMLLAGLLVLAAVPLVGTATALPPTCVSSGNVAACVFAGSWGDPAACGGEGFAGGEIRAGVGDGGRFLGAGVDNGCYVGTDPEGRSFEGSYVGVSVFDGSPGGDGFSRAHVNTGTQSGRDYCHAGIFNEQGAYTRLADCPPVARVPVLLALLP